MTADDIAGRGPVVRITDLAREKVPASAPAANLERLALRIEVIGISGGEYESTASFPLLEDAGPGRRRPAPQRLGDRHPRR